MSANPPERGVVDVLTPWDTDTEDQINQHKADVERARQIYQGYEQAMQSAQQGVVKDFGSLGTFDGDLGAIERDKSGTVKDAGTGIRTFDEPTSSSRSGAPSSSQPVTTGGPTSTQGYPTPHLPSSPQPDSRTSASGFAPSDVSRPAAAAPNYTTPGFNPPNTGFGQGGGNSSYHPPGFGPIGRPGGFGPAGGPPAGGGGRFPVPGVGAGANGMPRGGAAVGGAVGGAGGAVGGAGGTGAPGSGRATGTAPFGPAGGGPAAAGGAAGAAGGRGAMPMGAMGGAAGRGGQGGGDEEHQRQYVQATDEAFALTENGEVLRDPVTGNLVAPPTIGG